MNQVKKVPECEYSCQKPWRFEEAQTVFRYPSAVIFDDEAHSLCERREIIIGHSESNRLLTVCFTEETVLSVFSVHARQSERSVKIMRKMQCSESDDMLPEYNFDYSKARPNRFAKGRTVTLVSDVASVFNTSDSVNKIHIDCVKRVSVGSSSAIISHHQARAVDRVLLPGRCLMVGGCCF